MRYVKVTSDFIEDSKTLANDILGYNECFGGDRDTKIELKKHIRKCEKYLMNIKVEK